MQPDHFLTIILNEIANEGLEGVTLECLWEYLKAYEYFKDIDEKYKEFLWKFIRKFESINFFKLNEPRECNFKFGSRLDRYDFDKNCIVEESHSFFQTYTYHTIADINVYGSCPSYTSRDLVNNDVRKDSCSYSDVMKNYGNCLVIVATQEYRLSYLGLTEIVQSLSKPTYAFLELLVRSRSNGIKSMGTSSCLEFFKDSRCVWYVKKKLKAFGLVRVQKVDTLSSSGSIKPITLFHFHRFYKPFYNIFEQHFERFYLYINSILSCAFLKSVLPKILEFPNAFLNLAKKNGWVEVITATYRRLIQTMDSDIDSVYLDDEMLKFYLADFQLPTDEDYPLSLIDKPLCYIKPIKNLNDLQEQLKQLAANYENDDDPIPDVELGEEFNGINLDEPLDTQILKTIARTPMSAKEIKSVFNLKKLVLRGVMKSFKKNNQVFQNFKVIDRHSVPFFTISQELVTQKSNSQLPVKQPVQISFENDVEIKKFFHHSELTSAIRNPKRQERYNYLLSLISSQSIIPGFHIASKYIRDWEASKNLKEIMDRKSLKRIISDAVADRHLKIMEVTFQVHGQTITEEWLTSYELLKDSSIYEEHYNKRYAELLSKIRINQIDTSKNSNSKKSKKRKSRFVSSLNLTSEINVIKLVKNVTWRETFVPMKFPETPAMIKRKLLHEFIWYISIGSHHEDINLETKLDENGFRIFFDSFDWKRYVSPLQQDLEDHYIKFDLNDLLLRIPLCLFCLLVVPKECTQDLYDCLMDDDLRWANMQNLSATKLSVVSFLLNNTKKHGLRKMVGLLESLMDMGMITKCDQVPPIRTKEEAIFFLNREIFLTNTSNLRIPVSDEFIWGTLDRYQWILKTKADVINYWENAYNVCVNTPCSKSAYRPSGIQLLSRESHQNNRNSSFIAENVLETGLVSPENHENIRQFGAWLPSDSFQWKDIGPGGFYRSISSWCYLSWCPNRFDRLCGSLPNPINRVFLQFRCSLFTDFINSNSHVQISSLNENLSLMLNEINIFLTSAAILHYDDRLDVFWQKIRSRKWFKATFPNIYFQSFQALERHMLLLSVDHEKERNDLITEAKRLPFVKSYWLASNRKEFREENALKQASVIRILMLNLIKLHRFIPQWDLISSNQFTLSRFSINVIKTEGTNKLDLVRPKPPSDLLRKMIKPDFINNVTDIIIIQLTKYMTGCMHSYKEFFQLDLGKRNRIFQQYSQDLLLTVINGFQNFYVLEPLKANKSNTKLISSGSLDNRLNKLAGRLISRSQPESQKEIFIRRYLEWISPSKLDNDDSGLPCRYFKYVVSESEARDVMSLIGMTCCMRFENDNPDQDSFEFELDINNFSFDETAYDAKSVCQSRIYNINTKRKNLAHINWNQITKGTTLTIKLNEANYNNMFSSFAPIDVWDGISDFVTINEPLTPAKRCRTRSQAEIVETSKDKVLNFILQGQHSGRSYPELEAKFSNITVLLEDIKQLIEDKKIYLVGFNTFHFVSHEFIRSWLIKLPKEATSESPNLPKKRRKPSFSDDEKLYFLPEFYRSENGEFKSVTFLEMISRIYTHAYKCPGITMKGLINELSVWLGTVAVTQLVQILVKYQVLELRSLKKFGTPGLFKPRVRYESTEYNPFADPQLTTVIVKPISHINMYNLISDMSSYFSVDLFDYMTSDRKE